MDFSLEELNSDWINNFEKTDKLYQDFYKDDIYYINLQIIYINKLNEIEKIKQEPYLMSTPNKILSNELVEILNKHSLENEIKYRPLSLLKYNITLDTYDIKEFLKRENTKLPDFLHIVKNIEDISLDKTITMFQDLNELIILFIEKTLQNVTKKLFKKSNKKATRRS